MKPGLVELLRRLRAWHFQRLELLAVCLAVASVNLLVFYIVPQPAYDHRANLAAAAFMLVLLPLVRFNRFYPWVVNAMLLAVLGLMAYIAAMTGGVNSSVMVWLTVLAVPALLLLGRRPTLGWITAIMVTILGLLLAAERGWISSEVHIARSAVPWAFLNHALAVASMMLGLQLYERMHARQMQEADERNRALEETHRALVQAQRHKDEFVAAVGHELRTPMNAILGLNEVLRAEFAGEPERARTVDHIRQSTQHLLHVINDILDFSQLQTGRFHFFREPCQLSSWLEPTLQPLVARASAKGLALNFSIADDVPPHVMLDSQRLAQILGHLLGNAVKFTQLGRVDVHVSTRDGRLRFEVLDTGPGIAASRQQRIFNRFEYANLQVHLAFGGTGLGLSISERLVVLQGGAIGVVSEEGRGAMFWFELPLHGAPDQALAPSVMNADAAFDLLVVDDNAINRMVATLQLKKCWPNARVTAVESGAQALDLLRQQAFDMALVDMLMPDMDGLQLTRHIRAMKPPLSRLPIIAITANVNALDRERCLQSGMNDVLQKPFDDQALKLAMAALLGSKQGPTHAE